jgi:hypothetical protein
VQDFVDDRVEVVGNLLVEVEGVDVVGFLDQKDEMFIIEGLAAIVRFSLGFRVRLHEDPLHLLNEFLFFDGSLQIRLWFKQKYIGSGFNQVGVVV